MATKSVKEAEIIDLDTPARAEYLAIIRSVTLLVCKRMDFSEEKEEDIKAAIAEAYINVIKHAYRNSDRNYIKRANIRYLLYPEKLAIVVKDFGRGFDPHFVQLYVKRADTERPEKVGLGIFLIKTLMDEIEYNSTLRGGTEVRMTKYK